MYVDQILTNINSYCIINNYLQFVYPIGSTIINCIDALLMPLEYDALSTYRVLGSVLLIPSRAAKEQELAALREAASGTFQGRPPPPYGTCTGINKIYIYIYIYI